MHMRHSVLVLIAIIFSWILWTFVNFDVYNQLSGNTLMVEVMKDFGEQIVETTLLLEMSLLYIRKIVKAFWKAPHTMKSIACQVIVLAVINGISSVLMGIVYSLLFPNYQHLLVKIAFSDYINLSVLTTTYLVVFLINRYRDETDAILRIKMDNLALQTDNHFVFNCFSTLSGLMDTSTTDAKIFLQGLSQVYRYLVTYGAKRVVPLKYELSFINDYSKLICYRFSGVSIKIDETLLKLDAYICPFSLQGAVENAVKHNRHGKEDNLLIQVVLDEDRILVTNNIMLCEEKETGTGKGLETLKDRYSLLTNKEVFIVNDGKVFTVSIPVLYIEDLTDESIDY